MSNINEKIESNFNDIYKYILENSGIDLFDDIDEYFMEASHGKLKYDFREVYDYDTGHSLKIVYSLNGIKITDIGGHYLNDTFGDNSYNHKNETIKDIQKNIFRKGNTDHQSYGQKVLAIVDRVTNKTLKTARTFGPYSPIIKYSGIKIGFEYLAIPKEIIDKIHNFCNSKGQAYIDSNIHKVTVGEIDNTPSFKSTKWFTDNTFFKYKGKTIIPNTKQDKKDAFQAFKDGEEGLELYNNNNEMRTAAEHFKYGRGVKMDDIDPDYSKILDEIPKWKHPSKKELKRVARVNSGIKESYSAEDDMQVSVSNLEDANNYRIQEALDWIDNFTNDEEFRENAYNIMIERNTPQELLTWMKSNIRYGWRSIEDGKLYTDNNGDFFNEYKLQSPTQLVEGKYGVCWDQVELERRWFGKQGIEHGVFYIELQGENATPTHTFLVYHMHDKYWWFENAWGDYQGIRDYSDLKSLIIDVVLKHQSECNDKVSPVYVSWLKEAPSFGITCEEYMNYAHSQMQLDVNNLPLSFNESNDIFEEKSHGRLKYSFRVAANVENGHFIKIVFDLNPKSVSQIGDHANQWYHNADKDEETAKNITKTGHNNFSSRAKVLAIVDMDTKQNLKSVKTIGVLGGPSYNTTRFTVPEKYQNKKLGDHSTSFGAYPVTIREQIAKELNLTNSPDAITYTVGEMEKVPSYKATKAVNSISGLFKNQWKSGKGAVPLSKGIVRSDSDMSITFAVKKIEDRFNAIKNNLDTNDEDIDFLLDKWNRNMKKIKAEIENNKGEHFGQSVSDPRYYRYYKILEDSLSDLIDYSKKSIKKNPELYNNESYFVEDINIKDDPKDDEPPSLPGEEEESKDTPPNTEETPAEENPPTEEQPTTDEPPELEAPTEEEVPEETPIEDQPVEEEPSEQEEQPQEEEPVKKEEPKPESLPKQTDKAESSKNGVRRKKLYIAFIEWCKEFNNKNTFGSIFDKDAFKVSYPFVPDEMRYFYRLANPMLCVLAGDLTFFPVAELRKLNSKNTQLDKMMIFAATPNDLRVFNIEDKKVYRATEENGAIKLAEVLGDTYDTYIQKMINKGDILNGPIEESVDFLI